jgi:hypothetical protein
MAKRGRVPLTDHQRKVRKTIWISATGATVLVSVVGLVGALLSQPDEADQSQSAPAATPSATQEPAQRGSVVDASVAELGWSPEPITTDARAYGVAAAIAGSTYDTTLATRNQFRDNLATWHTLDPRYDLDADQQNALEGKLDELNRRVVIPASTWDTQAESNIAVTAAVDGDVLVDYDHLSPQPGSLDDLIADGYHLVTTDILATYTGRGDVSYEERYTVSVQVNCGSSTPAADSGQVPADCKLIRFFPETRK